MMLAHNYDFCVFPFTSTTTQGSLGKSALLLWYFHTPSLNILPWPSSPLPWPSSLYHGPAASTMAQQPSIMAQQPATMAQQPSTMAQQPSTMAQQPSTMAQQPSTMAQQPSTMAQQPSTMAQQPSTMAQQPLPWPSSLYHGPAASTMACNISKDTGSFRILCLLSTCICLKPSSTD